MFWEPLAEWGRLDSDFDELSPPSTPIEDLPYPPLVANTLSGVTSLYTYCVCFGNIQQFSLKEDKVSKG